MVARDRQTGRLKRKEERARRESAGEPASGLGRTQQSLVVLQRLQDGFSFTFPLHLANQPANQPTNSIWLDAMLCGGLREQAIDCRLDYCSPSTCKIGKK